MKKHKVDLLNNSENSKNSMKHLLFALSVLAVISIAPVYADNSLSITSEIGDNDIGYTPIHTTYENVSGNSIKFQVQSSQGEILFGPISNPVSQETHSGTLT